MNDIIKARISIILGIVSIAFGTIECYLPLVIMGMLIGFVAIGFGIASIKGEFKNKSIAGIILGITGIIIALIWLYMIMIVK